jgi:hypothetical protein
MSDTASPREMVAWEVLPEERQIRLRVEFGHYLDTLPPTCSLETKIERFRRWLQERGVSYRG